MSVLKHFECRHCDAEGKITIKGSDIILSDIVYCPVCSGDIYEEEEFDLDDEE
jgi:excinuclease UvrABC ATPase subunit